jgi:hypothetical protein
MEWVKPQANYFDGVCGGKAWENGKVLAKLIHAFPNQLKVGDDG